ncbi:putative phosphodiesterase [Azorhizobium sp. AG788]|uniref:metallophosphoesterase family protein n=1 Tax=Azorhizobium sp. AG788 TaxID=2183897 RepID=UPI00105E897C|nr:hypothetical protein [Azorhizobium sp. AG788]TDT87335.1 putative phosphodiesterase [Azorhizobium sp. AG788]
MPKHINGRVIEAGGLRIAGLGGVFRAAVWHPKDGSGEPRWRRRQEYLGAYPMERWRGDLPRQHRSSIWPEDLDALADIRADVLVTHEAPSSHPYGFEILGTLAEAMGVQTIIHGHLHQAYEATLANGVRVVGLAKAGVYEWPDDRAAAA